MGVSRTVPALALVLGFALGCGDPDQYLRHAKGDAGSLPITTGDTSGAAGAAGEKATGAAGAAAGSTGGAAPAGAAGAAAGSTGGAGASSAAGTSGAAGMAAAAGSGAAGTAGAGGTSSMAGASGAGAAGGAGATCPGCKVEIVYTCLANGSDSRNFAVEIKNTGSMLVLYKDLSLRYWYTADPSKTQELDCDTADRLGCGYIVKSADVPPSPQPKFVPVTPPRTKANEYAELDVIQGALDVGSTTGRIQLRLHNKDFSPIDQTMDYSADCGSIGQAHDSTKITAYIGGVLVWGTEPQ
jgi:hypothetical protein